MNTCYVARSFRPAGLSRSADRPPHRLGGAHRHGARYSSRRAPSTDCTYANMSLTCEKPRRTSVSSASPWHSVESNMGADLEPLSMVSMHASAAHHSGQGVPLDSSGLPGESGRPALATSRSRPAQASPTLRSIGLLTHPWWASVPKASAGR